MKYFNATLLSLVVIVNLYGTNTPLTEWVFPLAQTETVVAVLKSRASSPIQNYRMMGQIIDYYASCGDTCANRAEFEKIVETYFSFHDSPDIALRDMYIFNIVYDVAVKIASSINFKMVADVIFKYADSLNQQNGQGETPAHVFVKNAALGSAHFFEVLHMFKQHGANFTDIKDYAQKTVYDYIIDKAAGYLFSEKGVKDVTVSLVKEYLKKHGFNFNT